MIQSKNLRLTVAVMVGLFAGTHAIAGKTLNVEEQISLHAKAADVWKLVGDYGNLQAWHPVVANTTVTRGENNHVGAVRSIDTKDGAKLVEELLAYDGKKMRMRYKFLESPLPVSGYVSTVQVVGDGEGSRVIWKGQFKAKGVPDAKAQEIVAGIYKAGFDGLREKFSH